MIEYRQNHPLDPAEVARVLDASGITRPTDDLPRIGRMYSSSNLVISAWSEGTLVAVCRSMTDFSYTCYLADLAVDRKFQKQGIGRELVRRTQDALGDGVSIILLAAPDAMAYYPKIGFEKIENGYIVKRRH